MIYIIATLFGLAPLYLVRFNVVGVPTTVFEVALYSLFLFALIHALRKGEIRTLFSLPSEKLFRAGFFLLAIGVILSALLNPTFHAFGILKGWFLAPVMFFLIARYTAIQQGSSKNDQQPTTLMLHSMRVGKRLFAAYTLSGIVVALAALGYYAFGGVTFDGRLRAFFESPNHLAMFLAPAVLISFLRIFEPRRTGNEYANHSESPNGSTIRAFVHSLYIRYLFWILSPTRHSRYGDGACFVLCAFVLYLTKSHGAWIGVIGALVLTWIMPRISQNMRTVVISTVVAVGILLPFVAVRYLPAMQNVFGIWERSSIASRMMIWQSALAIGRDHMFFGVGPGAFQEHYLAYQKNYPPYLEWAVPQPHNIYLAFWLQTGIAGLVGFLFLLLWYFKKTLSVQATSPEESRRLLYGASYKLQAILIALMLYTLIHGAVDTLYWKNDLAVFFWALMAVVACIPRAEAALRIRSDANPVLP